MPFCKRYHFYEVNDQSWWPQILREKVQDALTLAWINKFPIIQPTSPAALVACVLSDTLGGRRVSDYVYVDFASGAGGPTPHIEQQLNATLRKLSKNEVQFVLTDISPHVNAWSVAAKKSENLTYVATSVDATNAPPPAVLLKDVAASGAERKKVMRLFSLAFHHFDDDLAADVLANTIESSHGFCIFELQSRNFSSLLLVTLLWPMLMLQTPFYFLHDPTYLFFTYLVPLVPFVVVLDGYISILRTRTPDEIRTLLEKKVPKHELAKWKFKSGEEMHTWPIGYLNWVMCYKEE